MQDEKEERKDKEGEKEIQGFYFFTVQSLFNNHTLFLFCIFWKRYFVGSKKAYLFNILFLACLNLSFPFSLSLFVQKYGDGASI